MAAASVDSATVSVGTLKSNPSIFFDRMDEVQDSILHQHTASMLSMPSNLLRGGLQEMVRERDAEDVTKFPRPNMGNTDHLSLPEDKEDDEEVTIETDDDFSDDGVRYEPPIIKPLDDDATSADDTEAADNNMDMDPLSHSNPTQIQQRTSNTSNPSSPPLPLPQQMVIHDSKEQSDEFGDDHTPSSFLHSMDTENFDDEFNVHSRGRSDGVSQEMASSAVNTQHYIQRPSVRKSRLGATLKADFDDHEHSHSDHSHSDWSHSHSHEHKVEESPPSHTTMSSERGLWNEGNPEEGAFPECNIRFEEDDWCDGKKPPAQEFVSLRFFYQFVYDQIHCYSQFLLDTSLPIYKEWKTMRKVTIRPNSLKTVDYALKECLKCSQSIKALVRNTIILCLDESQPESTQIFAKCEDPEIRATAFNVGLHSIMPAWDLFDGLGSTPSADDWRRALSLDEGVAQKLSSYPPDLSHLNPQWQRNQLVYHRGHHYKYLMISEFLNENGHMFQFGAGPIHWKTIKKRFLQKHGDEYGNEILSAFDRYSYFINPRLTKLNALLHDTDSKKMSSRRIIAEPIMWLFYMVSYLIQRQEKLTQLYVTAMKYSNDNSGNQRVNKCVSELAKSAKDESERLRAVMTRLPGTEDLKQTLVDLVKKRDPDGKQQYTKSLKQYKF